MRSPTKEIINLKWRKIKLSGHSAPPPPRARRSIDTYQRYRYYHILQKISNKGSTGMINKPRSALASQCYKMFLATFVFQIEIKMYDCIREAFIKKKKNYGKFHNRSDPPLPPRFDQNYGKYWKILIILWPQKVV